MFLIARDYSTLGYKVLAEPEVGSSSGGGVEQVPVNGVTVANRV